MSNRAQAQVLLVDWMQDPGVLQQCRVFCCHHDAAGSFDEDDIWQMLWDGVAPASQFKPEDMVDSLIDYSDDGDYPEGITDIDDMAPEDLAAKVKTVVGAYAQENSLDASTKPNDDGEVG